MLGTFELAAPRVRSSAWGKTLVLVVSFLAVGPASSNALGSDWIQWRGPSRSDVSPETGLLKVWPDAGPKLVWLFRDAGVGYSGFAVVEGVVYTMGGREGQEQLFALSADGKEVWATDIGPILDNGWGDGPRGTPTVAGDAIFAMGGKGHLIAVRREDGKLLWKTSMEELGGRRPGWGYTESVLVDGDRVICTPGGSEGTVAALDAKSGAVLWRSKEFTDGAQYSSPIRVEHEGTRQYVQLTMRHVAGVEATTGKLLWQFDWPGATAVIPTPIFHDGQVYVTSGYGVGCMLIKLGKGHEVDLVYKNKVMKNHHGGVVLVGEHLYGYSDGPGWLCQDFKSGETAWSERRALGKGALTYADGMLYCLSESDGTVALVEASPKGWNEVSRFRLDPQSKIRSSSGRIWTHPVISNGKLYLRDQDLIYCYDVSGK